MLFILFLFLSWGSVKLCAMETYRTPHLEDRIILRATPDEILKDTKEQLEKISVELEKLKMSMHNRDNVTEIEMYHYYFTCAKKAYYEVRTVSDFQLGKPMIDLRIKDFREKSVAVFIRTSLALEMHIKKLELARAVAPEEHISISGLVMHLDSEARY